MIPSSSLEGRDFFYQRSYGYSPKNQQSYRMKVTTEILKTHRVFFKTVQEKQNAQTLEFIYPRLFEFFPKEKMLEMMNQMQSDESVQIQVSEARIHYISPIIDHEDIHYALIRYTFEMQMYIPEPPPDEEEEYFIEDVWPEDGEDPEWDEQEAEWESEDSLEDFQEEKGEKKDELDFTHAGLVSQYGADKISFDRENRRFTIQVENEMYAIWDPAYPGWKFLEKKKNMEPLIRKILPSYILMAL